MSHSDLLPPLEHEDLGDEVARLFQDLDRAHPLDQRLMPGAFSPTLDSVETADASEIVLDMPGVPPDDLRVLIKATVMVIAGGKMPPNQSEQAPRP